jgi:hypothetical protein
MPQLKTSSLRLDAMRRGVENIATTLPRLADELMRQAADDVLAILRKPGRKISYPVHWDSQKQRRAYFASKGFGKGIPYHRTGGLNRSWKVARANDSPGGQRYGYYTVSSALKYAKYVAGNASGGQQSRIHAGRWTLFLGAFRKVIGKLPAKIRSKLYIGGKKWS